MPQLIHTLDSHVDLVHDSVTLFSYIYSPNVPAVESPRPYFHPLRTLKGNVVSGFRPHDHRWHHGLSMTCANLSGHNFWGGRTYLRDQGYVQLNNVGEQRTVQLDLAADLILSRLVWDNGVDIVDDLAKIFQEESEDIGPERWEIYERELRVLRASVEEDYWQLDFKSQITAPDNSAAIWGSPTTQGRENAGYGGLFWRGPRDFSGGQILMSDGREGADLMGQTSPWLAYIGQHDETDDYSTLIFVDDKENPRHPTPWFVRNTTPMVCPYFAFHQEYQQEPREILNLNYRIIIADGKWNRERIESVV